jgi:hypothetical protein
MSTETAKAEKELYNCTTLWRGFLFASLGQLQSTHSALDFWFDKLITNGIRGSPRTNNPFALSHFGKLRTGLSKGLAPQKRSSDCALGVALGVHMGAPLRVELRLG